MSSDAVAAYYKAPDASVRPGDIVRLSPFMNALKIPLHHISPSSSTKSGRVHTELLGHAQGQPVPANVASGTKETTFVVRGKLANAILLTRGCDIDNGKQRQLAAIRPLTLIQEEQSRADVIDGKTTSLHYLPADGTVLIEDSFIDFRYIVTLNRDLFDALERPLSLSREGVLDVYFSWMRHTIGKNIPATTKCEDCGADIPIFAPIKEIANPPDDY